MSPNLTQASEDMDPRKWPDNVGECPIFRNNRVFVGYNASKQSCFFGILSSDAELQQHKNEPVKCYRVWLSDGTVPPMDEVPHGISAITVEDSNVTKLADGLMERKANWLTLDAGDRTKRYANLLRAISDQKIRVRSDEQSTTFQVVKGFFPPPLRAGINDVPQCDESTSQRPSSQTSVDAPFSVNTPTLAPVDKRVAKLINRLEHVPKRYVPGLTNEINKILGHVQYDHGINALSNHRSAVRFATEVVDLFFRHIRNCGGLATQQKHLAHFLETENIPKEVANTALTARNTIEKYLRDVKNQIDGLRLSIAEVEKIAEEEESG